METGTSMVGIRRSTSEVSPFQEILICFLKDYSALLESRRLMHRHLKLKVTTVPGYIAGTNVLVTNLLARQILQSKQSEESYRGIASFLQHQARSVAWLAGHHHPHPRHEAPILPGSGRFADEGGPDLAGEELWDFSILLLVLRMPPTLVWNSRRLWIQSCLAKSACLCHGPR